MNDAGYIRKIDELGRIVIPKEVRKRLRISDGENLIINVSDKNIYLSKYSYVENNQKFIYTIGDKTSFLSGFNVIITDLEKIIYTNKPFENLMISSELKNYIKMINPVILSKLQINDNEKINGTISVEPIITNSLCMGLVIVYSNLPNDFISKIAKLTSNIISTHIDEA